MGKKSQKVQGEKGGGKNRGTIKAARPAPKNSGKSEGWAGEKEEQGGSVLTGKKKKVGRKHGKGLTHRDSAEKRRTENLVGGSFYRKAKGGEMQDILICAVIKGKGGALDLAKLAAQAGKKKSGSTGRDASGFNARSGHGGGRRQRMNSADHDLKVIALLQKAKKG